MIMLLDNVFSCHAAQRLALPAAGENKTAKRKTAKAQNQLKKRAESQPSHARLVGWGF
jgi:hypothetical protein